MLEASTVITWLLSPLSVAVLFAMLAWVAGRKRPRLARRLIVTAFAVLWIGSMPLTAHLLGSPLEHRYPAIAVAAAPKADAILVLGGAITGAHPPVRPNVALGPSADRVWQAAALYRAGKAPWLVVAGGERQPKEGLQVEADAMVQMLVVLGVPRERIRFEDRSRTTRENAVNSKPIMEGLGARRVLLVTSAQHLPRAVRTFESAWRGSGLVLVPFPADVLEEGDFFTFWALAPSVDALRYVTRTLKEYAGTVVLGIMETVTR